MPRQALGFAMSFVLLPILTAPASAEPPAGAVPDAAATSAGPHGWQTKWALGLTGSLAQSSHVPGTPDGATWQAGLLLDGVAQWRAGRLRWDSVLGVAQTQTRTPLLERFVKSVDRLDAESAVRWHLRGLWLGTYGRVRATTALLPGELVKPAAGQTAKRMASDTVLTAAFAAQQPVALTSAFEPLILGQGVGLFATGMASVPLTLTFEVGAGLQETMARDGFAVVDDASTPAIELRQLQGATQAGLEAAATADGQWHKRLGWRAKAALFQPLWTSRSGAPSGLDALQADLAAGISAKLGEWLSLEYRFTGRRIPVVIDRWQTTHGIVLSFSLLR
jgi:hypothetical protein